MHVTITLESGEHVTGTIHTLIVDHDRSDASVRVSPVEIDAITFDDLGTTLYPNAEPTNADVGTPCVNCGYCALHGSMHSCPCPREGEE